jgi:hypothetical protein
MSPSASFSNCTISSNSTEDDHPAAKYKYRKGRIRKRSRLFLQQSRSHWSKSLSLSMVVVSLIVISFGALLWLVDVSLVPAEQRQLHYTNTATNYATTTTATTVLTEKMFQSITEQLWQDQSIVGVSVVHVGNSNSNSNSNSSDNTNANNFAKVIQNNNVPGWNAVTSTNVLAKLFCLQRRSRSTPKPTPNKHPFTQDHLQKLVNEWSVQAISQVSQNLHAGMQWIPSYLLPTLSLSVTGESRNTADSDTDTVVDHLHDFGILARENRNETTKMAWELEWEEIKKMSALAPQALGPVIDYNDPTKYTYPEIQLDLPMQARTPSFELWERSLTCGHSIKTLRVHYLPRL